MSVMRFSILLLWLASADAFTLQGRDNSFTPELYMSTIVDEPVAKEKEIATLPKEPVDVTETAINARLAVQMEKLREKDRGSRQLSKEDFNIIYQDEHIVVADKPAGVLSVSPNNENFNFAQAVHEVCGCDLPKADMMVCHRLGMDTSGLMMFAKTMDAVRGLNTIFRTRKIERKYIALVCGHVKKDRGLIDLPLMRDYEFPPFVRVSTDDRQKLLVDLDHEVVGKKLLEAPKDSLTKYEVISREELDGLPVTRVALTSISGRTHQLNVHLAAFGHPIVGDTVYGINGSAAPNGGLTEKEAQWLAPNKNRADDDVQKAIAAVAEKACVHAISLRFRHPVTKEDVFLESDAPF